MFFCISIKIDYIDRIKILNNDFRVSMVERPGNFLARFCPVFTVANSRFKKNEI